jgi:hypothetical protein
VIMMGKWNNPAQKSNSHWTSLISFFANGRQASANNSASMLSPWPRRAHVRN